MSALLAILALVIVICAVTGFFIRPRRDDGTPIRDAGAPALPRGARSFPARRERCRRTPSGWIAEIEWRQTKAGPRFCAICPAPDAGGAATTVAESQPLVWPPTSPASVQALADAAEGLEAFLLDAGWTPLPPGSAWYAKRFAWELSPAPATDDAAEEDGGRTCSRPAPAWPAQAERLWRCEIRWDAGWAKSCFQAVAFPPRGRRGQPIGTSSALEWLWMGPPDPRSREHQNAVRGLATREVGGVGPVGRGPSWYSRRFAWPRQGGAIRAQPEVACTAGEAG